ncbi:Retrovirus-related Pol polyprotein from transposon 17.6 [Chionoecetes opilio]|uniref:Retrovirus-related Pol polyprotein from transposon 17.6 n=1 Tax=Chionoecetes opilio TaxID=41210 RepID=A0A8J8WN65_CHIOP|nr:Retrovirus-related Pol polyprotein from transposon 17.6 [Chionoecetes opilio]
MKDYFQKCTAEAVECQFRCRTCDTDLSDYMLLRKVMVGLSDPALKKEVFQGCPSFNSVGQLQQKCFAHEAAVRDAGVWCRAARSVIASTASWASTDDETEECVAADRAPTQRQQAPHASYLNCGYAHGPATSLYLSLGACKARKGLGLVPEAFPLHTQPVVGAACSESFQGGVSHQASPKLTEVPFPPLEENATRLEEWLLQRFSSTTFNTTRSPLPVMAGPPHHIPLVPGAAPYACHTPATVPKHWEAEVKAQLEEDVSRGVIEPVPAGEATDWCARMVVVAKKTGHPRRTVDFQRLNACCKRETHHTAAPFDMVSGVPVHTYKTVADAFWGFHQVELDAESRRLTTFITPWGCFRYRRTPMRHCSASDAYTKRFDDSVQDILRKYKCVDDTLLYDTCVEDAFWHTYEFLDTCARAGVTLKPEKVWFCRREAEFVGFHLGWEHYQPTSESLTAIREFAMPDRPTITDIRSWHGMVNQLAPFLATAPVMEPFRELLKRPAGKRVYWDEQLRQKFHQAQATLCQLAKDGLVYYDKSMPTAVVTDWSKEGLGFVVLQHHCACALPDTPFCCRGGWRLALYGSRHLSPAEAGYSAVEGEALAVAWCLRKARLFLLGCPNLLVVTDHRPLVGLFKDRSLAEVLNPRLLHLKEKTLHYRFAIKYLPGKQNNAADSLSRFSALKAAPDVDDIDQEEEIAAAVCAVMSAALEHDGPVTMDEEMVAKAASEDPAYQLLFNKVMSGDWHQHKAQEAPCLRPYFTVRDRLAVVGSLVTYTFGGGSVRLVVPAPLQYRVASNLHAGHQGLDSMLRCRRYVSAGGNSYLAYADRLTGWLELAHFPSSTSSSRIITRLRRFFARWGAPKEISTDGGTNVASSEMVTFLRTWGGQDLLKPANKSRDTSQDNFTMAVSKELRGRKVDISEPPPAVQRQASRRPATRSATETFLIGYPSSSISGSQLPTNRQAFQYFLHLQSLPENTGNPKHQDLANETVEAIIPFWQMARIKTMTKYNAAQHFMTLHKKHRDLARNNGRTGDPGGKRSAFVMELDSLFDIGASDAIQEIERNRLLSREKKDKDIRFYQDQKE